MDRVLLAGTPEKAEDDAEQLRALLEEAKKRAYAEGYQAGRLSWMQELITRVVRFHTN